MRAVCLLFATLMKPHTNGSSNATCEV